VVEPRARAELVSREVLAGRLREEVSRATRHRLPLALLVFDFGPSREGERALEQVTRAAALLARAVVRRDDVVGLLGAGAFAVVANATREGASALAAHLARQIKAVEFAGADGPVPVELRYTLACLSENVTADDLLKQARVARATLVVGD